VNLGADRGRELGIDQLLHPALQQQPEQVPGVAIAQVREQLLDAGIIITGHRVISSVSAFAGLTKSHAMAQPTGWTPLLPPPHGTLTTRAIRGSRSRR
jgi:hypothetical protein